MKKLLLFAFYIFCSVAILPCELSEKKKLDEELCSILLKRDEVDEEKDKDARLRLLKTLANDSTESIRRRLNRQKERLPYLEAEKEKKRNEELDKLRQETLDVFFNSYSSTF
jgi:hypothetical protein